jgi:hypothetical protein
MLNNVKFYIKYQLASPLTLTIIYSIQKIDGVNIFLDKM